MKERGIILAGPEVRAVQARTKTQHRVPITARDIAFAKGSDARSFSEIGKFAPTPSGSVGCYLRDFQGVSVGELRFPWQPGDRLWVRETWGYGSEPVPFSTARFYYQADDSGLFVAPGFWISPAQMPRKASRLTLEVLAVRAERLQEQTKADAIAEGVLTWNESDPKAWVVYAQNDWNSRYGKRSPWERNDWVFVTDWRLLDA